MKLISSLSAAIATVAFAASLLFDQHAVIFYAIAFSASLVLIAARDYAPRPRRWEPRRAPTGNPAPSRSAQNLQLAA